MDTTTVRLDVTERELQQDLTYGRRGPVLDASLLDATLDVLAREGLAGTTVDAVARHRGVARTTLYRRWPNREALVAAALSSFVGARVVVPDTGTLRGDLLDVARATAQLVERRSFRAIAPELVGAAERDQEWASALRDRFVAPGRTALGDAVERAIERGEVRPDVTTALVTELLVGALAYRAFVTREPIDAAYVDQLVDAVVAGVAPTAR